MVPLLPQPRSLARKMVGRNSPGDQQKKKKEEEKDKKKTRKLTRLLITVSVAGSTGPLRFIVNENDVVADVIHLTLKSYARLGRLPLLPSSDPNSFLLYCPLKFDAVSPKEAIGSCGARNFILWKKEEENEDVQERRMTFRDETQKQNHRRWNFKWKSCFIVQPEDVLASS